MRYDNRIIEVMKNINKGRILVLKGFSDILSKEVTIKCKKYKNRFYMQFLSKSKEWERYQKKEDVERDINGCLRRGDQILWENS